MTAQKDGTRFGGIDADDDLNEGDPADVESGDREEGKNGSDPVNELADDEPVAEPSQSSSGALVNLDAPEDENQEVGLDDFLKKEEEIKAAPKKCYTGTVELLMPNADRITVVGMLLDNSGSMLYKRKAVLDGLNRAIDALRGVKGSDFYLRIVGFHGEFYSGLISQVDIAHITQMYYADGCTPLVGTALQLFDDVKKIAEGYRAKGIPAKEALLLVTDGIPENDTAMPMDFAEKLGQANCYAVGMGIIKEEESSSRDDVRESEMVFRELFEKMGIKTVMTPNASPASIRHAFDEFSRSVSSIASM